MEGCRPGMGDPAGDDALPGRVPRQGPGGSECPREDLPPGW
ncbi:MAG TPA: hypothetical protein PLU94_05795 [Methanoregulaceae archaeon]|nr:hypothetical protein [Methanoregulaceae archaeon]